MSVITLDAEVVARPTLRLAATSAGTQFTSRVRPGDVVKAGGELAVYQSKGKIVRLLAPDDVEMVSIDAADKGSVDDNLPLVTVRSNGFGMQAAVTGELLYRLTQSLDNGRAQITNGPGPFACRIPGQVTRVDDSFVVTCIPDKAVKLYPGLPGILAVNAGSRRQVLTLPISAVAGLAGSGQVSVLRAGGYETVQVGLGISDGTSIEITSGVEAGDTVSSTPPALKLPERPR